MADDEILLIPTLPEEIVHAVNTGTLAIFVGAGVSRLLGCHSWPQLAANLVERCFVEKRPDKSTLITFKEKEFLLKENPKKTITVCKGLLETFNRADAYIDELKKSLRTGDSIPEPNIYDEIYRLRGLFLTTNADQHFDRLFDKHGIIYHPEKFPLNKPNQKHLYHLHGSILDPDSLVFTVPEYLKRYASERFTEFLRTIFDKYTVLFVGYGLEEFEVLDFLISKADAKPKGNVLRHFILLGLFKGDENILSHESNYYRQIGIKVKAFQKDSLGYNQLYEVLKDWNDRINRVSTYVVSSFEELEDVVANFEPRRARDVLQLAKNDVPQREKLFKLLASTQKPEKWLDLLLSNGYLIPEKNPRPQESKENKGYYSIPAWEVLGFLENLSQSNAEEPTATVTRKLKGLIKSLAEYTDTNGNRIDNYRTDWVVFKLIFNLPIDEITKKHIQYVGKFLKSKWGSTLISSDIGKIAFPKLLKGQAKQLTAELLRQIFTFRRVEKGASERYSSFVEFYWLGECLDTHTETIADLLQDEAIKIALRTIRTIVREDRSQFNNVWIPTIDASQQRFTERFEVQLIEFVQRAIEIVDPKSIKALVSQLLKEKHPIFKRIALHAIRIHYSTLKNCFWDWAITLNPLEESLLKHEMFELLKANASVFSKAQLKRIINWVESVSAKREGLTADQKIIVEAYRRKEWLSALTESKSTEINRLYTKYNDVNPAELEHPGHTSWMESGWVSDKSPIDLPSLLAKSNDEICKFILDFKANSSDWRGPNRDGLSTTLREGVKSNPAKFSSNLRPFLSLDPRYQCSVLRGFIEAWSEKRNFDWNSVFSFIAEMLAGPEFWTRDYSDGSNYRNWIIGATADLIRDGTRSDEHAFAPELLAQAETLILTLLEKTRSDLSDSDDIVNAVLNSTLGSVFVAAINYSLRCARLEPEPKEDRWPTAIRSEFTRQLNTEVPPIELLVCLGEYIRQMLYLDEAWYYSNLERIFPKSRTNAWEAAFTGYLFYANQVIRGIYKKFRSEGHYEKAITTKFRTAHISERLVQHICIAFVDGMEALDDPQSLISKLVATNDPALFRDMVQFFLRGRSKISAKQEKKLRELWKVILPIALSHDSDPEFKKLLSLLCEVLGTINTLDQEAVELLKKSLKYIEVGHHLFQVPEHFAKHVEMAPKQVAELFLALVTLGFHPTYEEATIKTVIDRLYQEGLRNEADQICISYFNANIEFVRPIYVEHRPQPRPQ